MSNKGFRVFFALASYLLSEPTFGRISKPSNNMDVSKKNGKGVGWDGSWSG